MIGSTCEGTAYPLLDRQPAQDAERQERRESDASEWYQRGDEAAVGERHDEEDGERRYDRYGAQVLLDEVVGIGLDRQDAGNLHVQRSPTQRFSGFLYAGRDTGRARPGLEGEQDR